MLIILLFNMLIFTIFRLLYLVFEIFVLIIFYINLYFYNKFVLLCECTCYEQVPFPQFPMVLLRVI